MSWWLLIPPYLVSWFPTAVYITRYFGKTPRCNSAGHVYHQKWECNHYHRASCWRIPEAPTRSDAQWGAVLALLWPLVVIYHLVYKWPTNAVLHTARKDPVTFARRKKIKGLSEAELTKLDAFLNDPKKLEL